jgi:predicted AAA+ superfamily ATPase
MSGMIKRGLENSIKTLLNKFPCVALLGARQVGKSTLLRMLLPKAKFFDLECALDYERLSDPSNLDLILQDSKGTLIFDEAQLYPELFSALRVRIDRHRKQNGQFLISRSSSPNLIKAITESLAGRVSMVEVPTLTWGEALRKKQSKFYQYLDAPQLFKRLRPHYEREDLFELCFYGLYPEPFLGRRDELKYQLWQENYIKSYIERDIRALFPQLNLDAYRRFIKMLCFSSGDLLKASDFASSLDVSQPTIKSYLEIAEGTFIWRKLLCYSKNTTKRLVKMPKGYIRNTNIVNHLLNIHSAEDLIAHPNFGKIWEAFIIEQLIKNLKALFIKANYYFYRTHHQAEIDFIIEGKFGLIPIEIKSGTFVKNEQLKTMRIFMEEHQCPYGLVINNSDNVEQISDKIYQIPAVCL